MEAVAQFGVTFASVLLTRTVVVYTQVRLWLVELLRTRLFLRLRSQPGAVAARETAGTYRRMNVSVA